MRAVIIALALLVCAAFATEEAYDDKDVVKLTSDNFDSIIQRDFVVVKFFAPWCGHCKHLAPEYAKAATILKNDEPAPILAEVDATVENELASRFSITGYPTLKIFRNGNESPYNGPRDADGIVRYVRSQNGPAAKLLTTIEAFEAQISKKDDVTIIGFFTEESAKSAFMTAANAMREDYRFALVLDKDIIAQKNEGKSGIVNYRPFDGEERAVAYTGELSDASAIKEFILSSSLPLVGIIKSATEKRYMQSSLPKFVLFTKIDEVRDVSSIKYYSNRMRRVAENYKGKALFALADKSHRNFGELGFAQDAVASLAIIAQNEAKYKLDAAFSVDTLKAFAEDFFAGKLEQYIKSQPIPESNDKPVKVVVGKTFEQEITNSDQDVFIKFYAPWCGHCKSLAPVYEELATKLANQKTLKIVEYDATENDVPALFNVHGFPTLYLLKANDKMHPVQYNGDRDLASMEDWLKENVSHPLKTDESEKKEEKKDKKDKKEKDKKEKKEKKKAKKEEKEKEEKEKEL